MKGDLSDILSDLISNKRTGLFSISVVDSNRLFKLFIRAGEIYRLSYGNLRGATCLASFDELEFKACFFLPDIELSGEHEVLPATADLISLFKIAAKAVFVKQPDNKGNDLPNSEPVDNLNMILGALKDALVEQIGPAGIKVFHRIADEKWRPSPAPTRRDLDRFVDLLKDVIEDSKDKLTFVTAANKILSS
jgi:hypothetical protein